MNRRLTILDEMVQELATAGPTPGSSRNFISQGNKYRRFCETLRLWPFPVDELRLCRYIAYLTLSLNTYASVQAYVGGVRKLQVYARIPWVANTPYMGLVMDGGKRVLNHVVNQAEPMTPEILKRMLKLVDRSNVNEVTCFTAILVSFCLFLRSSNIVALSTHGFDMNKQLTRKDFKVADDIILVHIKWSKTRQLFAKRLLVPLLPVLHSDISPIRWLHLMWGMMSGQPQQPAFMLWDETHGRIPLTYRKFTIALHDWTSRLGLNPKRFTGHCLRRGGCTWAFDINLPGKAIQLLGDWVSDAYLNCIDVSLEARLKAMAAFTNSL